MNHSDYDSNEQEKSKKQKYLKEEILEDDNYNADEFVDFLANAMEVKDGADIDNWTLDGLVEKVQEFRRMKDNLESKLN